jgi:hypothetical protein
LTLFSRSALEQNTGVLALRWQQDGSSLVNVFLQFVHNLVVHTVSTNKKFYLLRVIIDNGGGGRSELRDGNSTGTILTVADPSGDLSFDPPLAFSSAVYLKCADEVKTIQLVGWEE